MTELPDVIQSYFTAAEGEALDDLVAAMTPDVVVIDDGTTWEGHDGVRAWKSKVDHEFEFTTELTGARETSPSSYVVTGHVTGNFPGGEVDLDYAFDLDGDRIARLEIAPTGG